MAAFLVNPDECQISEPLLLAEDLWSHYEKAGFLYPAKLAMLLPFKAGILDLWQRLIESPADVFQVHYAMREGAITSSVAGFRDTPKRFVIQHASSVGQPEHLIECLLSIAATIGSMQIESVCMFYRPENKWPNRLRRAVQSCHPASLQETRTCRYMTAVPGPARWPEAVRQLDSVVEAGALSLLEMGSGTIGAASLGCHDGGRASHTPAFKAAGLSRRSLVLGYEREGRCLGVACLHLGDAPLNLSFLCSRVEIATAESGPDAWAVVRDLLVASRWLFNQNGSPLGVALVPSKGVTAAVAAGFRDQGRDYSAFSWSGEGVRGYASTCIAFSRWYSAFRPRPERANRTYQETV